MSKMTFTCPVSTCHAENDVLVEKCPGCGVALREYFRVSVYPSYLFNEGLRAARAGGFAQARDLFAAVTHWCPRDLAARNALAAACLELDDSQAARQYWEFVCKLSPTDAFAIRGLAVMQKETALRRENQGHPSAEQLDRKETIQDAQEGPAKEQPAKAAKWKRPKKG